MKTGIKVTALFISVGLLSGCAMNRTTKGGAIGAGIGGLFGGLIGNKAGNTAVGVLVGAVVGGAAGASIGRYMDKQAAELQRDLKNAKVERVGEGIKITFASGILFDVNSHRLKSTAQSNISDLARVLQKYEDTHILVQGHSDSTGSERHNQNLSEDRAGSVSSQLRSMGVARGRIDASGFGEGNPVADNGTSSGRQANRRVEVAIWANDKLKRAAAAGDI